MKTNTHIQAKCYHCGDVISSEPIVYQKKRFCCEGCKTVYSLLEQNDLCTFYNIEDDRFTSPVDFFDTEKFNYLELPEVAESFITFSNGTIHHTLFFVPNIHCSSCIWLLENLQRLNEGVRFSRVNFSKKEVTIAFDETKTSLRKVVELLAKIGYEPQINLDSADREDRPKNHKRDYITLGIVAFCFGNMMLISFPEYISFGHFIETNFRALFNYLNIAFSLPVLFIAGREYLIPSVKSLRAKQISIDVPIAIGIVALFCSSIYEILVMGNAGYLDSFGGLLFFLLLGKLFQQKTYDSLSFDRDYKSYFPISVNKVTDNIRVPISLKNLEVGDTIEIHHQELIPVDAFLTKGEALIDYSFITGESDPVRKTEGDKVYAGGKQVGGNIQLVVEKPFSQSTLVSLWNGKTFSKEENSSMDKLTTSVSRYFTIGVLAIATLSLFYWLPQETNLAWKAFVSVLIVACPCALALSSPFALGTLLRVFGGAKLFLKNALVGEKIWNIDTIVFDKTGTLTDQGKSEITYTGITLNEQERAQVSALTAHSTHPLSIQVHTFLENSTSLNVQSFLEVPGQGIVGQINRQEVRLGSRDFVLSSLALEGEEDNGTNVYLSIDGVFKGRFNIVNAYRKGVENVIKTLAYKYELHVLSGDNDTEQKHLKEWFGSASTLRFNQRPQDKLVYIEQLRHQGKNVMMIGDGLNDAGALKAADVGIAITQNITSFSPSSDGIMDASALPYLVRFLDISKRVGTIIKVSFLISIIYNLVGLSFAIQGLLTPVLSAILMPLSSITIVLFTTMSVQVVSQYYQRKQPVL